MRLDYGSCHIRLRIILDYSKDYITKNNGLHQISDRPVPYASLMAAKGMKC